MKNGKMIFGLLAGAAAGALTGVLLAPDKGSATRGNLSRRGRESIDGIRGKVTDLVETVSEKYMPGGRTQGNTGSSVGREQTTERSRSTSERTRSTGSQHNAPGAPSTGNI